MASLIEKKKIQVEFAKVQAARFEFELKIAEHMENIQRLEAQLELQLKKEKELETKLAEQE